MRRRGTVAKDEDLPSLCAEDWPAIEVEVGLQCAVGSCSMAADCADSWQL